MNVKTMEGLVGADTNQRLLHTPFRVYKEARLRGDTETMERALGYAGECTERARDYTEKAEEGTKEEAKEVREQAKAERERWIQSRREEQKELEQKAEEGRSQPTDTVEIGEDGQKALAQALQTGDKVGEAAAGAGKQEPVFYTEAGTASPGLAGAKVTFSA